MPPSTKKQLLYSRSTHSRTRTSYSFSRKRGLWKARFSFGFRWGMLLLSLGVINLYIFYLRKDTSLPAIQQSLHNRNSPEKMVSFALPSLSFLANSDSAKQQEQPIEYYNLTELVVQNVASLKQLFTQTGIKPSHQEQIFHKIKPENAFTFKKVTIYYNQFGTWVALDLETQHGDRFRVQKNETAHLSFSNFMGPISRKLEVISGIISNDESLYDAIPIKNAKYLSSKILDIFSFDKDLLTQCATGDSFKFVIEKIFQGNQFLHYGKILGIQYVTSTETFTAFWFEGTKITSGYYDDKGRSLQRAWLRSPLLPTRTSFSKNLKPLKPTTTSQNKKKSFITTYFGTPNTFVRAITFGKVLPCINKQCAWKIVQGDLEIYYHNLTSLLPSIKLGQKVRIGQRISSLSKSHHESTVGISILKHNVLINPLQLAPRTGASLTGTQQEVFMKERLRILKLLGPERFRTVASVNEINI